MEISPTWFSVSKDSEGGGYYAVSQDFPAKRTRVSATDLARTNRLKRARCTIGSPTLRIISQIQLSTPTTRRSPRSSTAQNACGKTTISIVDNNII